MIKPSAKYYFLGDVVDQIKSGKLEAYFNDTSLVMNGGHAVAIVGYDDNGFIFKNSWGTGWGDKGYGWVSFDYHRLFCAEAFGMALGKVKANVVSDAGKNESNIEPSSIWIKTLPHEYHNEMLDQKSKGLEISIVYHGKSVTSKFMEILEETGCHPTILNWMFSFK